MTPTLRCANEQDLPAIMAIERLPGYADLVGSRSHDEHCQDMANPSYRHFVLESDGQIIGFAVLTGFGHPWGIVSIHRIAVAEGGKGTGTLFTRLVCDKLFEEMAIYRIVLDVLPDNARARRAYQKVGFFEEGLMRQALRYPDGRRADLILMALLRPEWEVRAA
ncbi:GNAT family N-acetyltransferase [Devosia sp. A369]